MNISARNVLKGTVKQVVPGEVNSQVTLELPGGTEIVAIITKDSAQRLNLSNGQSAHAVIKASDVMIATD